MAMRTKSASTKSHRVMLTLSPDLMARAAKEQASIYRKTGIEPPFAQVVAAAVERGLPAKK